MMMRWHRPLTVEDVETAEQLRERHMPTEPDLLGRRRCASALHLVSAPAWPCGPAFWCNEVLKAADRGEIAAFQI